MLAKQRRNVFAVDYVQLFRCFVVLSSLSAVGCTESEAPKASHHEHDHEVAEHWPKDLSDAAGKIRTRAEKIAGAERSNRAQEELIEELVELISWTPEVAADTDLAEADWVPIYLASESLSANLRRSRAALKDSDREEVLRFCSLVEQSVERIPDSITHRGGESQ